MELEREREREKELELFILQWATLQLEPESRSKNFARLTEKLGNNGSRQKAPNSVCTAMVAVSSLVWYSL